MLGGNAIAGGNGGLSIIVPAHDEEGNIDRCLDAIFADVTTRRPVRAVEVLVVANGCTDKTVMLARQHEGRFAGAGIDLAVIDMETAGKGHALNRGDAAAAGDIRVYLDCDVTISGGMIAALERALGGRAPAYASGTIDPWCGGSWWSRAYARVWVRLPFIAEDVCGCGLYAVNQAGRARWQDFPVIHSDDRFVRLQFSSEERVSVPQRYRWPVPDGLRNLVRVRSRWNRGNTELGVEYPDLTRHDNRRRRNPWEMARLMAGDPVGFGAFSLVFLLAHLRNLLGINRDNSAWERAR